MPPTLAPGALPLPGAPPPLPLPGMGAMPPGLPPGGADPSQQDLERQMLIEMLQQVPAGLTTPKAFAPATGEGVGGRRVT